MADLAMTDNGDLLLTREGILLDTDRFPVDLIHYKPEWRNLVQNVIITLHTLTGEWPLRPDIGTRSEDYIGSQYTYNTHRELIASVEGAIRAILLSGMSFEVEGTPTSANSCNFTIKIIAGSERIFILQFSYSFVEGLAIEGMAMSLFNEGSN